MNTPVKRKMTAVVMSMPKIMDPINGTATRTMKKVPTNVLMDEEE